jgi:tetratricopeptide (TPR) repeat protein
VVAALVGFLASLTGLYEFTEGRLAREPAMSGDLKVAVAGFGELDGGGRVLQTATTRDLAAGMADAIDRDLQPLARRNFVVQVRGPSSIGHLSGATATERVDWARKRANAVHADLLVFGVLNRGPEGASLAPQFVLTEGLLADAEELLGDHQFGSPIEVSGDPDHNLAFGRELRTALLHRTQALVRFAIGLGYYASGDLDRAILYFKEARGVAGWQGDEGTQVIYLFLGNAAGRRGDPSTAREWYRRALQADPDYVRARIGLAELRFLEASGAGSCQRKHVDVHGLADALAQFERARAARNRPASSLVDAKIAFGLGRVHACRSQAGIADEWAAAEAAFTAVLQDPLIRDGRAQRLAAEAYAGLALVYLPVEGQTNAEAHYQRAADAYQQAIHRSPVSQRRGVFYGLLAHVYRRLDHHAQARDAYLQAMRLDPAHRAAYKSELDRLGGQP